MSKGEPDDDGFEHLTDRELDALIAEKCMGGVYQFFQSNGLEWTVSYDCPFYSREIGPAFEVVAKMPVEIEWEKRECEFVMARGKHHDGIIYWCAGYYDLGESYDPMAHFIDDLSSEGAGLERAICIAALRVWFWRINNGQ